MGHACAGPAVSPPHPDLANIVCDLADEYVHSRISLGTSRIPSTQLSVAHIDFGGGKLDWLRLCADAGAGGSASL